MRVKQTAKKITTDEQVDTNSVAVDQANCNNHSSDNANELSDNEVEFVVECRRDLEGNQFLLDGTLVIEPAEVAEIPNQIEQKSKQQKIEEIDFAQFIKEIQTPISDKANNNNVVSTQTAVKKPQLFGPFANPPITVKCTACNSKFNPFMENSLHKHPVLEVILCKDCIENQKDKYFVIDEEDNKETLCRWCVEGGSLICCDFCSKSYCKTCIKRNLGRTVLAEILNQDDSVQWKCFSCDPTPIKILQESFSKVYSEIDKFKENRGKVQIKTNKKPIPRIDSVNKKRSISKAFPPTSNSHTGLSAGKVFNPLSVKIMNQSNNPNVNTINLLNNMEGFGTEWYMRNVNLENILAGIDKIDPRSLLNAINSTKKCVEAFYSDIRNLENEISKAGTSTDISAIVSMFKSVYRHHIFNRFCQVQSRIDEDRKARFVPQTINGGSGNGNGNSNTSEPTSNNHNSPVGPSLMINSVISKAVPNYAKRSNNNSFTPNLIAKKMRQLTNGERKTLPVMYSIDLTDDTDKAEIAANKHPTVDKIIEEVSEEIHRMPKEVVDLCNDDDSSTISYPVVCMNFNNQLFAENQS